MLGASIVLVVLLTGLLAPLLAPYDPYAQNLSIAFQSPGFPHIFGTDEYGRDMFSRVLYGARLAQLEITVSVGMALVIGVPLGMISGYLGGATDQVILWLIDLLYAFPGIVLAILIVAILGPGLFDSLVAISIFSIPVYTRLARNLTLSLKQIEYVEAARALGAGTWRILFHHILRNAAAPILVQATLTAGRCGVDGVRAQLFGARRSASIGGVGSHDGRRPQLPRCRYLPYVFSWRRDHAHGPRFEPAGGWLARPARSALSSALSSGSGVSGGTAKKCQKCDKSDKSPS